MKSLNCNKRRNLCAYFYHKRSSNLLNYLTLKISDPEIERNLGQLQAENFDRLYYPLLIITGLLFFYQLAAYFINSPSSLPTLVAFATFFGSQIFVWGLLRKYGKQHAPKYILYVLILNGTLVNLFYYDVLLEEKMFDKSRYDSTLSFILFMLCCINYNSLKFTIFLIFPSFILLASF